jgi:S-adenosylmethionine-diacylgycerolhomoserine-N-methlytransferase
MSLLSDLKILYHMTLRPIRGQDHAARLESFYAGQADAYDEFRRRLLQGRRELWDAISVPEQGVWVDMGGGTGANLEYFGDRIERLKKVYVVDLSPSLLQVAARRVQDHGWTNVETREADATTFQLAGETVDVVTFSYSLTMISDWYAALDNARCMLQPGGSLGVVDFYVARKHPPDGLRRHSWFTRTFWPIWFAGDNVFPSSDHIPYLHRHFDPLHFEERRAKIPYLPFVRAPYYTFVGRKRT